MIKNVIDASVAVKWFTREQGHTQAAAIRDNHIQNKIRLTAPDLLLYELANVLRYNKNLTPEDIKQALKAINMIGVTLIHPTETLINKAIDTAIKYNITIYDASYLALAETQETTLITADEKLAKKNPETVKTLTTDNTG